MASSSELRDEVVRAQRRRVRADEEYREALAHARACGVSYSELARWLGVSRQAVAQYLREGES